MFERVYKHLNLQKNMELRLYRRFVKRYGQRVRNLEKKIGRNSRFSDIAGNLVASMGSQLWLMGKKGKTNELIKSFMKNEISIKEYFKLLEKYPEFKDAEIKEPEGYFPEVTKYVYGSQGIRERKGIEEDSVPRHYVRLCKEKLEKTYN